MRDDSDATAYGASAYPVNVLPSATQPQGYYHATTALEGTRLAFLIDPGAWTNAGGKKTMAEAAKAALRRGYKVSQRKLDHPLYLSGVGNGAQVCLWEMTIPMAIPVRGDDGKITHSELFKFVAPVVEDPTGQGKGEDLLIILGLRSQSSKKGVLEMDPGKQALTFPGPGGYEIDWKPGATRIAVEKALSSH